jgi:3-hydroxyisobutyrate dehydrogenase-like beta-hydroxyacid dehydrogenase
MGAAMAGRLLQAGHEVTVYNRTPSKAQGLIARGAHLAARVADACRGEAVLTMLAVDAAVEGVVFGERGVLRNLGERTVHVSMSTISVALAERLAEGHATAGRRFVAAPVFGRPDAAARGKLFIIAAGEPAAIDACTPLFDAMGQRTLRIGAAPQAANLVKLSGNFLIASVLEALSEAMALIRKAGIDPQRYYELLTSTLFTGPVFTNYGGLIARQEYQPAGFAAPLGEKDIRLALAAAEALRVPMPLASLVHDRLQTLIARGGGQLDWSALGQLAATDAGLRDRQRPPSNPLPSSTPAGTDRDRTTRSQETRHGPHRGRTPRGHPGPRGGPANLRRRRRQPQPGDGRHPPQRLGAVGGRAP